MFSIDNEIFEKSISKYREDLIFQSKELAFIEDTTVGAYSSNTITFNTESWANGGKYTDYENGLIVLPIVIRALADAVDFTTGTDLLLALKNSNYNFLHKFVLQLNNKDLITSCDFMNQYINYKLHESLSIMDEELFGDLIGYKKDSSTSWSFEPTSSSVGQGICNNVNSGVDVASVYCAGDNFNEGMLKRQKLFNVAGPAIALRNNNYKSLVFGDTDNTLKSTHINNTIVNATGTKVYYYTATLRLKDITDFFADMPLVQKTKLKLTLHVNNLIDFTVSKSTAGLLSFSNFVNPLSTTNPIMCAASYRPVHAPPELINDAGTAADLTKVAVKQVYTGSGAASLQCAKTCNIRVRFGKIDGYEHTIPKCRLYCPLYVMRTNKDKEYIEENNGVRSIHFHDVLHVPVSVRGKNTFSIDLGSTFPRPKRMIIVPVLSDAPYVAALNGGTGSGGNGIDPLSSPFTTESATTSPYIMSNFQVKLSNNNVYPEAITYSHEHWCQEAAGQYGIDAGLLNGSSSSRISLVDFQNNYHYIVVDLSRKLKSDDFTNQAIRMTGKIESPLDLTFHCFVELEQSILINVTNGMRVDSVV